MRAAALGLGLALTLAACTTGDDRPTVDTGATTSTTAGATTSSAPTTAPLAAPPVSAPAPGQRAYLTAVRAAASPGGGSRVVFETDPVVPGYVVDYVERPVTEDGSGKKIAVDGAAVLQVRLLDASGARLDGEKVVLTYTGPKRVPATGTGGVVTEVVAAGDFEGQVTWVIGLRARPAGIRVSTLSAPSRLVIDVPAP